MLGALIWATEGQAHEITFTPPENNIAKYDIDQLAVSETGQVRTISWCAPADQQSDNWRTDVAIHEFLTDEDSVPVASAEFNAATTSWDWTPTRAGLYVIRARMCDTDTDPHNCSLWGDSAGQLETPGCPTNPQDFVLYIKLAAPTGGEIE